MGQSRTPRYVLHIRCSDNRYYTPMEWQTKARYQTPGYGRPTVENIDKWVTAFENSLKPGQPNAHLGHVTVIEAWIVDQFSDRSEVCRWRRSEARPNEPLFRVV